MLNSAETQLLSFLLDHAQEDFGLYPLARQTGLSHTWIYRLVRKLAKEKMVVLKDKKVKINLTEERTINLKLYLDGEKISLAPFSHKINLLAAKIKEIYGDDLLSLCLIGSAVSKKEPEDLDFLIVAKKTRRQELSFFASEEKINLIELEEKDFKEKYLATDDFLICSLASQRILFDRNFIIRFIQRPLPFPDKQIIAERTGQLLPLRERLVVSLSLNDQKNILEILSALLVQLTRIKLLKSGILPLSKPELPAQIKKIDSKLYADFTAIIKKEASFSKIKQLANNYAKQDFRSF